MGTARKKVTMYVGVGSSFGKKYPGIFSIFHSAQHSLLSDENFDALELDEKRVKAFLRQSAIAGPFFFRLD